MFTIEEKTRATGNWKTERIPGVDARKKSDVVKAAKRLFTETVKYLKNRHGYYAIRVVDEKGASVYEDSYEVERSLVLGKLIRITNRLVKSWYAKFEN